MAAMGRADPRMCPSWAPIPCSGDCGYAFRLASALGAHVADLIVRGDMVRDGTRTAFRFQHASDGVRHITGEPTGADLGLMGRAADPSVDICGPTKASGRGLTTRRGCYGVRSQWPTKPRLLTQSVTRSALGEDSRAL